MQKFYFQSVTPEGKQISGYISAMDAGEARQKLKDSKLSILTLEKRNTDVPADTNVKVFEFEAENQEKKIVKGSIESPDMYEAFKKLRKNYKFNIHFLVPADLPLEEKERLKKEPINPDFEKRLTIENQNEAKKLKKKHGIRSESDEDETERILKYREEELAFIRNKIDMVLQEIIPLLEENADYIDPFKKREIEERIDLLFRLKHSNAVEHLKHITEKLLKELSSDEMFLSQEGLSPEAVEEIERRREQFMNINDKFSKAITKGIIDLQVKFSDLSIEGLTEAIASFRILEKIRMIFLYFFLSFFVITIGFWIFVASQKILHLNVEKTTFYLHSPFLFYVTSFAIISSIWLFVLGFPRFNTWKEKIMVLLGGVVVHILFLIQFPVLFFWT